MAQQPLEHDGGVVDRQSEGEAPARFFSAAMIGTTWCAESAAIRRCPRVRRLLALEQGLRLFLDGEQAAGDALELAAGLGRHDGAAAPVEQVDAVGPFQRGDLARKVGLAQPDRAAAAEKRARLGDEVKGAELAGRHISETDT